MDNTEQLSENYFYIADFFIKISFEKTRINYMTLLPSFEPFRVRELSGDLLFQLTIDHNLCPCSKKMREHIGRFDTGSGETVVDRLPDGGYQYIIKDIDGSECCLLVTNKNFSNCHCALKGNRNMCSFGLNNALMLIYAFAGCTKQILLLHASLVRCNGYGYAFIAKSGTGKSTQVSMWLRYIDNCDLMNDDNPIVRIIDGKPYIYGSPWSGKTPCYRRVKAPLGAITRIERAKANSVERLKPVNAFTSVLPSSSAMKWDKAIFDAICNNVIRVVESTPIYILHCLPNEEAARICHKEISIS